MARITLSLYGAFRDLASTPMLRFELPQAQRIADLRDALPAQFAAEHAERARALIAVSAFASDTALLRDSDPLPADGALSILPPVSGG